MPVASKTSEFLGVNATTNYCMPDICLEAVDDFDLKPVGLEYNKSKMDAFCSVGI